MLMWAKRYQVQWDTVPALETFTVQGGRQGCSVHPTYWPGQGRRRPDAFGLSSVSPRAFPSEAAAAASRWGPGGQKATFELSPHKAGCGSWLQSPGVRACLTPCPMCAFLCLLSSSLNAEMAAWWRQERLLGCQGLALTRARLPGAAG